MRKRRLPLTPAIVAERAAAIRATWTPEERERRRVFKGIVPPVIVQTVSTKDLNGDTSQELMDEMVGWEYLEDYELQRHNEEFRKRHHSKEDMLNGDELVEYVEAIVVEFGERVS